MEHVFEIRNTIVKMLDRLIDHAFVQKTLTKYDDNISEIVTKGHNMKTEKYDIYIYNDELYIRRIDFSVLFKV